MPRRTQIPLLIRLAIAVGALVLFAAGGYLLLVQPKSAEKKSLTSDIAGLRQEIATRQMQTQQADAISKIQVADLFRLRTAMPDTANMPELMIELNAIADQSGIRFDSIQPGQIVTLTGYQAQPITVIIGGSFYDLSDFLNRVRSLVLVQNGKLFAQGRLVTIDKIDLVEGDNHFPDLKATLTLNAYIYGSGPALATAAAGISGESTTTTTTTTAPTTTTTTTTTTASSSAAAAAQPTTSEGAGS
jgi:Tfp pilus assembly protein PilO